MLQRSPIQNHPANVLADIHDDFSATFSDLSEELQDFYGNESAYAARKIIRLAAKTQALLDAFCDAAPELLGLGGEKCLCLEDIEGLAKQAEEQMTFDDPSFDPNDEHRIGCFEAGVGRYGSWGR